MKEVSLFLLNKKPNALHFTIKLALSLESSETTDRRMQKIHLLEILSCGGPKTLTSMRGQEMHKHQVDLQHCPIKRKESVPSLSDTQVLLYEEQLKI